MSPFILLLIGVIVVVGGILLLRLHPFLALILGAFTVGILTSDNLLMEYGTHTGLDPSQVQDLTNKSVGVRIATAFGNTMGRIGILIAMASVIGGCLLKSGAAERIIRSSLKIVGEKRIPLALTSSAFTLGIPVFFDTVFYLMIPLVKALAIRTKRNYALYLMAIISAGVMAHSLVPPTPGPLFVAGELGVNIGVMMIAGISLGIITVGGGFVYAVYINRKIPVPVRDSDDASLSELESLSNQQEKDLPALWIALMPIFLPVILIAGNTILQVTIGAQAEKTGFEQNMLALFGTLGNSNLALTLSAGIALVTVTYKLKSRDLIKKNVLDALQSAGIIILITGAGGAFGNMLQQTDIGFQIKELATQYKISIIPLAFIVSALVRTAQGSATVAMITAVGILGTITNSPGSLDFHPVYIALAIGCGSKIFPWMNDSGFWIICKMSGMTESETIRNFSVLLSIMGIVGLIAIMICSKLIPLV